MKRNKKGFTLVELVIVIAVIAILAGVMIAVFSGVVRRANENAELQQVKNDELKQKAEDVLTKLDNANWFSWEDFENSLAEKLTSEYKRYASENQTITSDAVEKAVKSALEEFAKNNVSENTSLTEAQVKYIVENAISKASLGGVTEAQVRTIINTAVSGINTVSKADIQRIVDAAVAKGLTADAVAQKIAEAKLASATSVADLSAKVESVISALNALKPVTKSDVEDAIIDLLPVTYTANTADEFKTAVGRLNSFSTIYVNFTPAEALEVKTDAVKTLIIKGSVTIDELTVDAPNATIYLATDAGLVDVKATAQNSFHVASKVTTLNVNSGRVVVEGNAVVTTLKAAPSVTTTVKVAIEEEGTVTNLIAEYQKNGNETRDYIVVENNGTVENAKLKIVAGDEVKTEVTTNVKVVNGANAKGTEVDDVKTAVDTAAGETAELLIADERTPAGTLYNVYTDAPNETVELVIEPAPEVAYLYWIDQYAGEFAGGEGTFANPYEISNAYELARVAYLVNNPDTRDDYKDKYYVLTSDVDLGGKIWISIGTGNDGSNANPFKGHIDGNNKTVYNMSSLEATYYELKARKMGTWSSATGKDVVQDGFVGYAEDATIKNIYIVGAVFENSKFEKSGFIVCCADGNTVLENCHVDSTSRYYGKSNIGGLVGLVNSNGVLILKNCSSAASITLASSRGAGFVGALYGGTKMFATDCTFTGIISGDRLGGFIGRSTSSYADLSEGCHFKNCHMLGTLTPNTAGDYGYVEAWQADSTPYITLDGCTYKDVTSGTVKSFALTDEHVFGYIDGSNISAWFGVDGVMCENSEVFENGEFVYEIDVTTNKFTYTVNQGMLIKIARNYCDFANTSFVGSDGVTFTLQRWGNLTNFIFANNTQFYDADGNLLDGEVTGGVNVGVGLNYVFTWDTTLNGWKLAA